MDFSFNPMMWGNYMNNNLLIYFLVAMIVPMIAHGYLMSTFGRFKRKRASSGLTGHDVARRMLDRNGLYDVRIEITKGKLSDHYDPRSRTVRLSPDIHNTASVAAVSVAAHEVGHAIQHAEDFGPLKLRSALVPVVNISNRLGFIAILVGMFLDMFVIAQIGIILIAAIFIFQLITLPVEFNASTRAMSGMEDLNILHDPNEKRGARKVLTAAALTYVAALIVALMELLRWVAILNNRRR